MKMKSSIICERSQVKPWRYNHRYMVFNAAEWICPICHRAPLVTIEFECPVCKKMFGETFNIDFMPTGAADADHESHLLAERKFAKRQFDYYDGVGSRDGSRFSQFLPQCFREHIELHENRMFRAGAASRDQEISKRLSELNKQAESIIAGLTEELLLKRQQECHHNAERHWLTTGTGKNSLLCSECFKVLQVKFVGTSTQHGESVGLKIVTEK